MLRTGLSNHGRSALETLTLRQAQGERKLYRNFWRITPGQLAAGLLHYPEQWDDVGSDGEEKDMQAGKRQRSDRGRPGSMVVDAKEKPVDGARQRE